MDVAGFASGIFDLSERLIDRVAIGAIGVDLLHQRKCDAELLFAKCQNLFWCTGLLLSELIGRKANNVKALGFILGVKRLKHSRANILGTVLTKFDLNKSTYGYGYDYNYSYSYGGTTGDARESA